MSAKHTPGDAVMSATKTIPLQAVSDALMCAVIRLKSLRADGQRHGRVAAFTQVPFWQSTCRDRVRHRPPVRVMKQTFSPMHTGDMDRVLERTRLHHGLKEVRRTWGAGYRALVNEFNSTVMR
jgi:hypothetical protein